MSSFDNIPGRLGSAMQDQVSGQDDPTKNFGVASAIRKLLPGGGGDGGKIVRLGTDKNTKDILTEGQQAKPDPDVSPEDGAALAEELGTGNTGRAVDDAAQVPTESQTTGAAVETPDGEVLQADGIAPEAPTPDAETPIEPVGMADPDVEIDQEAITASVRDFQEGDAESRTWERNVNLDYIENGEQLGRILDENAEMMPEVERESFGAIEGDVAGSEVEIVRDVLSDPKNYNTALNARQLLAGRKVMVSMLTEVDELERKIADPSIEVSTEDLLKYEKISGQTIMLQNFMQGAVRETARAMNSMKIVASTINSRDLQAMQHMAKQSNLNTEAKARMAQEIKAEAKARGVELTPAEQAKALGQQSLVHQYTSAIMNLWTASILSGFKTQFVNVISNLTMNAMNTVLVRPVAGVISPIRQFAAKGLSFVGDGAGVEMAETSAQLVATKQGFIDAVQMGSRLFKQGLIDNKGEYISSFGEKRADDVTRGTKTLSELTGLEKVPLIGGLANLYERTVQAASYGALGAGDEFFKAMAYRQAIYGAAVREAYHGGLKGDALTAKANELINSPSKKMHDEAMAEAERLTFTNDTKGILGVIADGTANLANANPVLKFIVPFVKTPVALLDRSIKMSPIAPLQKEFREKLAKGGPEADVALAEMTVGSVVTALAYWMYQEDVITGGGPEDFGQHKPLKRQGWQPYSVRVDNSYVAINRGLDPLGTSVVSMAKAMDRIKYSETEAGAGDIFAAVALATAAHFKEAPYMQGFANMMQLIDGKKNFDQWSAQQLAGFVPALARDLTSVYRGVAGEPTIPYSPKSDQFWEMFGNNIISKVGPQDGLPPLRYWDGTEFDANGGEATYLYNSVSPIRVSHLQDHPASIALVENGISVPEPSSKITIVSGSGTKIDLLNDLQDGAKIYDRYLEYVGKARHQAVEAATKYKGFNDMERGPGTVQEELLNKALIAGTKMGKQQFIAWMMDGNVPVAKHGEKATLLNEENLTDLYKKMQTGGLNLDETELLREAGTKGLKTNEPLYVPRMR